MVKVVIVRKIKGGMQETFWEMTSQMRAKAVPRRGYISGETWVDENDPSRCVVISTWVNYEDWQAWERSPQRIELAGNIENLLEEPTRIFALRPLQSADVLCPAA